MPNDNDLIRIDFRQGDRGRWRWYAVDRSSKKTLFISASPRGFPTQEDAKRNAEAIHAKVIAPAVQAAKQSFDKLLDKYRKDSKASLAAKDKKLREEHASLELECQHGNDLRRERRYLHKENDRLRLWLCIAGGVALTSLFWALGLHFEWFSR